MKPFQPAISLMNRLKYPQKFALISCLFILPLSLVSYLLLSEIQSRINFAKKELFGTIYLRSLNQLWVALPQLKTWQAQKSNPNQIITIENQIDNVVETLKIIDRKVGKKLATTDGFNRLQSTWKTIQINRYSNNKTAYYNLMITQIDELTNQVGNQSNLILDPDLDTYYLMDATLLKLPEIQRILAEIQSISQTVSRREQATFLERAQLIMLLGMLRDYNDELNRNLNVAFTNNPAGNLRPKLKQALQRFTQDIKKLSDRVSTLISSKEVAQPDTYFVDAQRNMKQSEIFWNQTIDELDFLLKRRIEGFLRRQILISILISIILGIVTYLSIGFYLGVMKTVSSLSAASQKMVAGILTDTITLDSHDELAEVVKSFNNIAVALVESHQEVTRLNQRLKTENNRMSAELDITRQLQQMILPKDNELAGITGLDIAGFMEAATEVGGDYYDVLQRNGIIKIGIGDVTGHGLESGVVMLMVQTAVRTLLENNETDYRKFLNTINRTIYNNIQRMNSDKNLTLSLVDYQNGHLRLSGQHEEMIIVREGGKIERIDTIDLGFPIGLEADITDFVSQAEVNLNSGEGVVLYTDGITEAENMAGVQYGVERLCDIVSKNWQKSAPEIRQAAITDLQDYIGYQKIYDDITLLVIKQK
ncbi:MAG TPA: serine/threonine protein phosphatase [Cyanobacteria bacterium UBA11149]|nr:serine/threonine protein phosphatase [Cyanobacteria bacterium UBA11367]HBE56392.1 serine/threonine protein phosphatase [Cyanobacteria bacterium UBA11366]HBK63168.1 serine/threonine protein phosphatase [Cyanobacteria bacterium UBA11166]HBR76355.1 serine/threonine protein phosphatase [Cyanobacteria bacterium UBA11159]HBS71551.1 serine/threonine protein phosphatase [Cyanobacteria bacterium UBA11153]HBW88820.1 serine/threonine protein phosphatase [Cyanobacteria bacterium UBA11149]HCA94177.1 se